MGEYGIGQSVPREEDPYLVRGVGRYVDDVTPAGAGARLRAAFAACARAHRRSTRQPPRRCRACSVLTGNDHAMLALGIQKPPCRASARRLAGTRDAACWRWREKACAIVGDQVAFVVAETLEQAKDAAEAIEVDYEDVAGGRELEERSAPDAPQLWDECPRQLQGFVYQAGDKAADEPLRQGRHRRQAPHGDQPHHHQLDGAARLSRRIRSRATIAPRCADGAGAAPDPPALAKKSLRSRKTRSASSPKMSAAASA